MYEPNIQDALFFGVAIAAAEEAASMISPVDLRDRVSAGIRDRQLTFAPDADGLLWIFVAGLRLCAIPAAAFVDDDPDAAFVDDDPDAS